MGLSSNDKLPVGINEAEAYKAIRKWYKANVDLALARNDAYGKSAAALIKALPARPSPVELKAVLAEVILGLLEFAYHKDDGQYKMAAYAHEALKTMGTDFQMSPADRAALEPSKIFKQLSVIHR